jgi:oligopeptide/dipeptide ABC transporter ATP-binding protein
VAGRRERIVLRGEMPDPAHPPSGCAFHTRCPRAFELCARERPALVRRNLNATAGASGREREAACHLYEVA